MNKNTNTKTIEIIEVKTSLKAQIIFSTFVVLLIIIMFSFYTLLNSKEKMIKDVLASYDIKIKALQQQKIQLKSQANILTTNLENEKKLYASLNSKLAKISTTKPLIKKPSTPFTPAVSNPPVYQPPVVYNPTVIINPPVVKPPVVIPPRTTRAS
jgi:hypothetical protein